MDDSNEGIRILSPVYHMDLPGTLLFAKVWGSRSHNTHLPDSDTDFLAVYAAPTQKLLGIDDVKDTVDSEKPDIQAHEARKFCHLLLKGNPAILEMLYTERTTFATESWMALEAHRDKFLCAQAVRQYLGYAEGQLKKLIAHGGKGGLHTKGGDYNEKWAYHLIRLLWDARRIAQGQPPLVWKDGDEREALMNIRNGMVSRTVVEGMARSIISEIESMKPWPIPDQGDKEYLNSWLLDVRRKYP